MSNPELQQINKRKWNQIKDELNNPLAWLPTGRMLVGDGFPQLVKIGKNAGRGIGAEFLTEWILFDRAYVKAWLKRNLFRQLRGIPYADLLAILDEIRCELIAENDYD